MSLNPRVGLLFDGRCEEAFQFYEQCLNGKLEFVLRWGESPTAQDAPAPRFGSVTDRFGVSWTINYEKSE